MTGFTDLVLKTSYHKFEDDIPRDFYVPVMVRAVQYDRAVGYFRSAAFIIVWSALRGFVARGGRMRIVCSHVLGTADIAALDEGYEARLDEEIEARLRNEIRSLLADETVAAPIRVLAALVGTGVLEVRVAVLPAAPGAAHARLFHDKLGLLRDGEGNTVEFRGSMNETWLGLSDDGNLDSVDVAASWMGERDRQRTEREEAFFEALWEDRYPGVRVRPFPDVAKGDLIAAAPADWEKAVDDLIAAQTAAREAPEDVPNDPAGKGRRILDHQSKGLAAWRDNGRRGILAFATGAGKTFTALLAIAEAIEVGDVPVVLVPTTPMFDQWRTEELEPLCDAMGVDLLRAGAGNDGWREHLHAWTAPGEARRMVIATIQTARTDGFRAALAGGCHLMLVVDEVHGAGSPVNRGLLDDARWGARLGLSATPERYGDPEGTEAILTFFDGVLEPRYTLQDAINDEVLTKYFYRPHAIELTENEAAAWRDLSRRMARARARAGAAADGERITAVDILAAERARIVKGAARKVGLAVDVLTEEYRPGQRWLVYCDTRSQLAQVRAALADAGMRSRAYYAEMTADRQATLSWFRDVGGVLVAINCLDEGVDIPAITHALILASSKNPRQFVQRRGRVLRTARDKVYAHIHDAIVVPPSLRGGGAGADEDDGKWDTVTTAELARAVQFAQSADNSGAASDLVNIAIDAGIDWRTLANVGVEDDDDA